MFFNTEPRQQDRAKPGDPLRTLAAQLAYAEDLANDNARIVYGWLCHEQTAEEYRREIENIVTSSDTDRGCEAEARFLRSCAEAINSHRQLVKLEQRTLLLSWDCQHPFIH